MLIILLFMFYINASLVLAQNAKPLHKKTAWNATEEVIDRLDKMIETAKQTGKVGNIDTAATTIGAAADTMEITDLLEKLDVLQQHRKDRLLPEPEKALSSNQKLDWAILKEQIRGQKYLPVDKVKAHPAAKAFPGAVDVKAKRVKKAVEIWTDRPGWRNKGRYSDWRKKDWQSTGLYAAPGEIITVTVAEAATDTGLSIRIGAHSDLLWKLDEWKRAPEICRSFDIRDAVTKAANAFGGPIYIETPHDCTLGRFNVTIDGAVEMPWYIAGKTTSHEWKEIRDNPAPWAELQTAKIVLTLPSEHVKGMDDPDELMEFWDGVMDSCADLLGKGHNRKRAERFVTDTQIRAFSMHAGYPLMGGLNRAGTFVDKARIMRNEQSAWGLFHEIGHNHQNHLWVYRGTTEVTVNLFTLYIYEKMCGLGPEDKISIGVLPATREYRLKRYLEDGKTFDDWKKEPFLALYMYSMMQEEFGWEPFTKVFKEYRAADESELPKNDDDKRDQWMVRFSRMVGMNLGPFFDAWGVPTSQEAKKSISSLPPWMPTDFAKVKSKKYENIAAMHWEDFDRLICKLYEDVFTATGGKVKVTQASSDGVSFHAVVGFEPDSIRSGKILIQAKRSTNIVGVAAVRDFYGTVVNEGATRSFLVTTSDYDKDSYEFARGKPLVLINGRNLLRALEMRGHFYCIDIAEAKTLLKNGDDLDSDPNNAAFMAMTQDQLGHVGKGRSAVNTFRDSLEDIRFADITSGKLSSWIAAEKIFAGTNEQLLAIWELVGTKKLDQAVTMFAEIQPSPKDADSDYAFSLQGLVQYLSRICYAQGKSRLLDKDQGYIDRASDYEAAVSIDPNYVSALKDLAWLQTTCPIRKVRKFTEAIALATQACELTDYKNHECISILAASYSETGDFAAAVKWQKTAIALLLDDYPIALRANYEARCSVYQSHKPYHKGSLWSFSDGELIAHWKFNEVARGEVLDSTGKGLHGRLIGDAHIVSDVERGSALRLPSKGDFVDCGWNPAADITGAMTITAWMKVTELDGRQEIVSTKNYGLQLWGDVHMEDANRILPAYWYKNEVWINAELDADGQWHLIVGLYNGQKFALYIDGKLCASKRFYKSIELATSRLYIGKTEGWKDGLIDDIRIYSYALSEEEVKMLYEGKEPPRTKGSDWHGN